MTQTHGVGTTQLLNTALSATERAGGARIGAGSSPKGEAAGKEHAVTTLSGTGSLLAASPPDGDVRTEKVAALKAAIESGTYHVPAAAVADKIISNLLG